jgi:hypothetical protein
VVATKKVAAAAVEDTETAIKLKILTLY